jgi:hypothetical protein
VIVNVHDQRAGRPPRKQKRQNPGTDSLIRVDPRYASVPLDRRLPLYQELQQRLAAPVTAL